MTMAAISAGTGHSGHRMRKGWVATVFLRAALAPIPYASVALGAAGSVSVRMSD